MSTTRQNPNLDELAAKLAQEVIRRLKSETGGASGGSLGESSSSQLISTKNLLPKDIAQYIDHTLLKPDATSDQIRKLCEEAKQYGFATVCVNSSNVRLAAELLKGSSVKAIAVVGFPLGAATPKAKAFETLEAIRNGAGEIDMVLNIGATKERDYQTALNDIMAVVGAAGDTPVKVILETSQLNDEEKLIACALSKAAGAAFVKTSTGFGGGGATVEDIKLMRRVVGPHMGVKASGGVKSLEDAMKMLEAGANRLGTSSSVAIVTGSVTGSASGQKATGNY